MPLYTVVMDALVKGLGRFLARDFVFIVAGSGVILTFCYVFDRLWILEMPNALYFVAAGFAYVVGYAIQDLVSLTRLFTMADFFKPGRLERTIYRRFEGHEWREIEPFDAGAVRSELDRPPEQGGLPEGTRLRFERLVSLRMIGSAVGSSSLLCAALLVYRALQFREPFDVGLAVALFLLACGLVALARLKSLQQLELMCQIHSQAAAGGKSAPQQAWRR